ncbi:hypothetical protein [Parerythrobacter jejuensis]|uniref:Uncharacterized protein n=1 Tax=Parerythrobacter jejuensis TaxID=795812 RepID=A0A845AX50_9SPHN|nr:hypothetical protein [Parerythrobacter jejuensis]MXP30591.1 hypothetical protein [Parerythrobacter jejuensis]MXP33351.1 hypothetical protein [Parerythrobacter jejuensis]
MIRIGTSAWQVILADLALILFLTTLAGFVAAREREPVRPRDTVVAQGHALFREVDGGTSLTEWLALEAPDPRIRLTIFGRYLAQDRNRVWERASRMAGEANMAGYSPRLIIEPGPSSDVYVVLAYDAAAVRP